MLTDKQGADLLAERDPEKRAAAVAAMTEDKAVDGFVQGLLSTR